MSKSRYTVSEKLSILKEAKENANVAQTCLKYDISRTQFYHYKKCFKERGIIGLRDNDIYRSRRRKYDDNTIAKILLIVLTQPLLSIKDIVKKLEKEQIFLSSMGVYNLLKSHQLESKHNRAKALELKIKSGQLRQLNAKQRIFLTDVNPHFGYYKKLQSPSQELSQDIISYQSNKQSYYLYLVVDRFSNYVFARVEKDKSKQYLIELLLQGLHQFNNLWLISQTVCTSNVNIFLGNQSCPYQKILKTQHLNARILDIRPKYDACIQHFLDTSKNQGNLVDLFHDQNALESWVKRYNEHGYKIDYPHYGKSPSQMISTYLETQKTWLKIHKVVKKNYGFIIPMARIVKQNRHNPNNKIIYATQNCFKLGRVAKTNNIISR